MMYNVNPFALYVTDDYLIARFAANEICNIVSMKVTHRDN